MIAHHTLLSSARRGVLAGNFFAHSKVGHRFMSVINISDMDATEKFTEINSKAVLYFTASWCPPCKAIKPVYEKLAGKYEGVAFGKIDVDENPDAAMEFQVRGVPMFVFFNGNEKVKEFTGADQTQLELTIQDLDQA